MSEGNQFEYILFLVFILLILGNSKSFDNYFNLLNKQTNKITNMLNAFQTTTDSLKTTFETAANNNVKYINDKNKKVDNKDV